MRPPRVLPLLLAVPALLAFDYGTPIRVTSEDDVYELEYEGEIDEDMRDVLLDLLAEPLDPNTASREELQQLPDVTYALADAILAARRAKPFTDTSELRPLVGRPVWRQIEPFVEVARRADGQRRVSGSASARVMDASSDGEVPAGYARSRVKYAKWIEGGILVGEQEQLYGPDWSGAEPAFDGYGPRVRLERAYAAARRGVWSVIAGHYGMGFGQRLTFDETERERPQGWVAELKVDEQSDFDGYTVPRHLLGLAGTLEWPLARGPALRFTAWGSMSPHDLYFADAGTARDNITVLGGEPPDYPTLPRVYREDLAGGNATLAWSKDVHVGATAWVGRTVKAFDYEFSTADLPNASPYGAAGVDGAWSNGVLDLYGETAVTFTGGVAARVESVWNPAPAEVTLAARYYGIGFDNPHSRGSSQADELTGQRDRDEVGPQAKVVWNATPWLRLGAKGDVWRRMTQDVWKAATEARIDVDPLDAVGVYVKGSLTDKDLSDGDEQPAYDCGTGRICQGRALAGGVGARLEPVPSVRLEAYYRERYETRTDDWQRDVYGWLKGSWRITDGVEITARYRREEERLGELPGAKFWSAYGAARVRLPGRVDLHGRYEWTHPLDDPGAPSERRFKAGVDVRF